MVDHDAALLSELAAVSGHAPEDLTLPTEAIGESESADWALRVGRRDVAVRAGEYLGRDGER